MPQLLPQVSYLSPSLLPEHLSGLVTILFPAEYSTTGNAKLCQ